MALPRRPSRLICRRLILVSLLARSHGGPCINACSGSAPTDVEEMGTMTQLQGADRPLRPYGSAHFRPGLAMDTNCSD
jgi:hypothetical protein